MQTRQKSQALTPVVERALEKWALRMGAQGVRQRLDIFKAMQEKLRQEEGGNGLGPIWL